MATEPVTADRVKQSGPYDGPRLALPLLLAAVLIFYFRILFTPSYSIPWDFRGFHLPLATALFDAMRGTGSVLWDTTTYCGRPLFADPQAQVFYPPTDLAVLVSTLLGPSSVAYLLEWQLALHVFAAGAFTYLFLRRLGVSSPAAFCSGLVYELGGFFASQTQHLGAINSATWIPLLWAAAWELRGGFSNKWYLILTLAGGMSLLAGFPAVASTAFISTILYLLLLVAFQAMPLRRIGTVLSGMILSVGVSGIMLLPAAQLTLLSVAKYRTDWFHGSGFPLQYLITLILPPSHRTVSDLLYCGIAGLLLALLGSFAHPTRRTTLPLICVTLMSGVWMLGTVTPFGRLIWAITPDLVKGSLYPHYGMTAFCLGIAALAGIGLDRIQRLSIRQKYAVAILVAADLILVGSGRPNNTVDLRGEPGITRDRIDGSAATMRRLRQLVSGQPPSRTDTHEGSQSFASTGPLTQIPTANGYNPLALERLIQVRLSFAKGYRWGAWYEVEDLQSPMIDALNIRYVFTSHPVDGMRSYSRTADLPGFLVYENRTALPRFWMVHQIQAVHTPAEAFSAIHQHDFKPSILAVVEDVSPKDHVKASDLHPDDHVDVVHYEPRDIVVSVKSTIPGFLVSSETHYPGWSAYIDGNKASILMTNGAFRGLRVPAGDHTIHFRFTPNILYLGITVSALSLCLTLLVSRWQFRFSGLER